MVAVEEQARAIFLAALERAAGQWPAFLDEACGENTGVRSRVEKLLEAHQAMGSIDAGKAGETLGAQRAGEVPDTVIGPYKLLERIGEGGMGEVWTAQQTEPVKRLVAVKLIKTGMDSRVVLARFEAERQALALMDHPNIARVLDAGATPGGRPYFVMELVKGQSITAYCDERKLTPLRRLELFVPICQAIQHAHQKGVIHRDIKPSNVLVAQYDDRPVPKVIDFGFVKATGQALTEQTLHTGFGAVVGTPEYMSPEQAGFNHLDVDTRSDVYSLGVLLYELLAGSPPFSRKELEKAGMLEMLRVIREQEPSKPSTKLSTADGLPSLAANRGTEPAKLTRLVRGELDWIVMKALEKDRNRRYETANGFAADVQRYLADESVLACPPSAGYRLRKFASRNRRTLVTTTLLAFALLVAVGAVAGSLGWASRDRAARQAAVDQEAERTLDEAVQSLGEQKWPEALSAIKRAEVLLRGSGNEVLRERAGELRWDVEMVLRLEDIRLQLADIATEDNAFDTLAESTAHTQAFREYGIDMEAIPVEQAAELIRSRRIAVELAIALDAWALSNPSQRSSSDKLRSISRAADPNESRNLLRAALLLPIKERKAALAGLVASDRNRTLPPVTLRVLGNWLRTVGLTDEGVSVLRDAQFRYPGDFWLNFELAQTLRELKPPPREEVIRFFTAAVALRPGSVGMLHNLSWAYFKHGDTDTAIMLAQKMLALNPKFSPAYGVLSEYLRAKGRDNEAIAILQTGIDTNSDAYRLHTSLGLMYLDQLKKPDDAMACFQRAIASTASYAPAHSGLGTCLRRLDRLEDAVASFLKAIDLDPKFVFPRAALGDVRIQQDRWDDAIAVLKDALTIDQNHAALHASLGQALDGKDLSEEAIASYKRAIAIDPKYAFAHNGLGLALEYSNKDNEPISIRWNEAIACHRKAIEFDEKYEHPRRSLARILRSYGKSDEAIVHLRKAIDINSKNAQNHIDLAGIYLHDKKMQAEAITHLQTAIQVDPKVALPHMFMASIREQQGWPEAALARYRKASEIGPTASRDHLALAHNLKGLGDLDRATVHYQKAAETFVKPVEKSPAYHWLGRAQMQKGLWDEAIASFKRCVEIDARVGLPYQWAEILANIPQRQDPAAAVRLAQALIKVTQAGDKRLGRAWQALAWGSYRLGDYKGAIVAINKVKELGSPGDSMEWFLLALAHKQLGNEKEAREWYVKGVEWMTNNRSNHAQLGLIRAEASRTFGELFGEPSPREIAPPPRAKK